MINIENPISPEKRNKEVKFYIIFETTEERDKAKQTINQLLEEDKKDGIPQLPAGPDYPITRKSILEGEYTEYHNDENPEQANFGLEISFAHTPTYFPSPESLEKFIVDRLKERDLHISKKDGNLQVYEVVGGEPQNYTMKA